MTKTACGGDVIPPSTSWASTKASILADRGFQRCFQSGRAEVGPETDWQISAKSPPGWAIKMHYNNTQEIWDDLRHLCPDFYGATYEKMGELGYIHVGRAAMSPTPTRGPLICLKRVRYPRTVGAVLHLRPGVADRQTYRRVSDGALHRARSRAITRVAP